MEKESTRNVVISVDRTIISEKELKTSTSLPTHSKDIGSSSEINTTHNNLKVNLSSNSFPCCLIWSNILFVTQICPFIGHIAITK